MTGAPPGTKKGRYPNPGTSLPVFDEGGAQPLPSCGHGVVTSAARADGRR